MSHLDSRTPPLLPHAAAPARNTRSAQLAWALLALAVLCWAGNFVTGRALRDEVSPVALTFWRWTVALALLLPFTYHGLKTRWQAIRHSWKVLLLLAAFASVLQHIPVYWGLRETTATNAALLNATSPIFILLSSVAILHERLRPIAVIGTALSLAGVVVIVIRGDWQVLRTLTLNPGDGWILASSVAWAGYTITLRWRPADLSGLQLLTAITGASVLMLGPLWALESATGRTFHPSAAAIGGILYVGAFASVVAYIAYNRGVAIIGPARAAPFMYLMLLYTPLLSIGLLGESVHAYHLAGGVLIIAGIYLATVFGRR
jgi:drug/metabolite transporter (DMT)-like permease